MKFLVWIHDPCSEGGWQMKEEFETAEEAIEGAKRINAEEEKMRNEMMADMDEAGKGKYFSWCYDEAIVTQEPVFKIRLKEGKISRGT